MTHVISISKVIRDVQRQLTHLSWTVHARFSGDGLHYQKLMRTVLGMVVTKWHAPPFPPPNASTFLIITEWRPCLTWLRQQPTQHIYFLDVLSITNLTDICTLLFYPVLIIFSCKRKMSCMQTNTLSIYF